MKYIYLASFFLLIGGEPLLAQFSSDPNHEIYRQIDYWEGRGYVRQLPMFKPYPEQILKEIFETVITMGDPTARAQAQYYMDHLRGSINWEITGEFDGVSDLSKYHWKLGMGAAIQGYMTPLITYSAELRGFVFQKDAQAILPRLTRHSYDIVMDDFSVGSGDRQFSTLLQLKSSATIGKGGFYFQSGVMRRSFGSLHDGIVLSSLAPHTGNFLVHWRGKKLSYSGALFMFSASSRYSLSQDNKKTAHFTLREGRDFYSTSPNPANGESFIYRQYLRQANPQSSGWVPNKFMHLHMLTFYLTPWLEFAMFESTIWGSRFDPKYLLPFKVQFHLQSVGGFPDNTFIGSFFDVRIGRSVKLTTLLYVDDMGASDFIQFKWTDTKFKLASHTGISWTPLSRVFKRLSLDYLLITPYTYTHFSNNGSFTEEANYSNYTNAGQSLGPSLEPNSDRLTIRAVFAPAPWAEIELMGRFSQHGNASEGLIVGADGSIWDDGYTSDMDNADNHDATTSTDLTNVKSQPTFQKGTRFLTQSVIERIIQVGTTIRLDLLTGKQKRINLRGSLEYLFQYTLNEDLKVGVNTMKHYFSLNAELAFFPKKRK